MNNIFIFGTFLSKILHKKYNYLISQLNFIFRLLHLHVWGKYFSPPPPPPHHHHHQIGIVVPGNPFKKHPNKFKKGRNVVYSVKFPHFIFDIKELFLSLFVTHSRQKNWVYGFMLQMGNTNQSVILHCVFLNLSILLKNL